MRDSLLSVFGIKLNTSHEQVKLFVAFFWHHYKIYWNIFRCFFARANNNPFTHLNTLDCAHKMAPVDETSDYSESMRAIVDRFNELEEKAGWIAEFMVSFSHLN